MTLLPLCCWLRPAQVLGPRRRTVVNYKEKGYSRFDSDDDDEAAGARRRKRASADKAEDFAPDAAGTEGDAQDDDMLPHKKKHKKRDVSGQETPIAAVNSCMADICIAWLIRVCSSGARLANTFRGDMLSVLAPCSCTYHHSAAYSRLLLLLLLPCMGCAAGAGC
jgi:hypothetical protein